MNDTIDKLRRNFATGMTSARISDDEWRDVFLPVIRDAERYRAIRDNLGDWRLMVWNGKWSEVTGNPDDIDVNADMDVRNAAIDAAMSATTEESK